MIEVKVSGKCVGCPACDLEVSRLFVDLVPAEATVYCRNARLCEHLEKFISDRALAAEQAEKE